MFGTTFSMDTIRKSFHLGGASAQGSQGKHDKNGKHGSTHASNGSSHAAHDSKGKKTPKSADLQNSLKRDSQYRRSGNI